MTQLRNPLALPRKKLSKKYVKIKMKELIETGSEDMLDIYAEMYGDSIPIYHAATDETVPLIKKYGMKHVPVCNYKSFAPSEGFYVQVGRSDYVSEERSHLFFTTVSVAYMNSKSVIDSDGLMSEEKLAEIMGVSEGDIWDINSDTRDFVNAVVSNDYDLEGLEFFFDKGLAEKDDKPLKMKLIDYK